jgi:hypothetical protein
MFLPLLLAGAVELRKPPKAGRATSYAFRGTAFDIVVDGGMKVW